MNGAESLVKTLLASGVDVCFANPGTSEMHFVAALDDHPQMRCILCLFEGGTSGAADGYYRMSRRVAATLLHLAPGFGNAFANLHNARKAQSGVLNVMGEHATYHLRHESPLKGDTSGISQSISHWTRTTADAAQVAADRPGITRVQAEHIEHIAEVKTGRLHPDLHLVRPRRRNLDLGQTEVVNRTSFGRGQDVVGRPRQRELSAARPVQ